MEDGTVADITAGLRSVEVDNPEGASSPLVDMEDDTRECCWREDGTDSVGHAGDVAEWTAGGEGRAMSDSSSSALGEGGGRRPREHSERCPVAERPVSAKPPTTPSRQTNGSVSIHVSAGVDATWRWT